MSATAAAGRRGAWGPLRWLLPLSAVPLVALLAYGFRTDPRAIPSPLVERPAPDFALPPLGGGDPVTLASLRGKVVVLNFWASWCYPACYEEAPVLEAGWRKWRGRGVVVVGVNMQDTEPAAREFVNRFGFSFPNLVDRDGKTPIDYGVYGVPETFFIGRDGRIARKHVGAVTPGLLEETLRGLVAGS